jgi:hypothetical protein
VNITGQLTGSGTLVIMEGGTDVAQTMSGTANTFSGQWIVKAGWLLGAGTNSLGTNSITIDPGWVVPEPPWDLSTVEVRGPALLEVNYNINSAGTLILTNGGQFKLHQNCCFTAVIIEGTLLTSGTHYYADLAAQFSATANFPSGGYGSITVQPYGTTPVLAPTITTQPVPVTLYAGQTAAFTVTATGHAPLTYQWQKNGVNFTNIVGHISGATNATLTISSISATDASNYDVVVTGSSGSGSTESSVVSLTVLSSPSEPYATAVLAARPVAFYEFNDLGNSETNGAAFDYAGGFNGIYGNGVLNGSYGIAGPTSANGFPGFAANNLAAQFLNGVPNSEVTVPPWNLNTNTVTITAWINPYGAQGSYYGLVMCRGNGTAAWLGYSGNTDPVTGNYTLGATWNGGFWDSGLYAPRYQWSFVALVVTPTNATIYIMNTNGLVSSSVSGTFAVQGFGGTTWIGDDPADGGDGAQAFTGIIDDVAVFTSAFSQSQLLALFSAANGGVVNFAPLIEFEPASQELVTGLTVQLDVGAGGSAPLFFQWQAGGTGLSVFTNLSDTGNIYGSATATLTITEVTLANAADYRVIITNAYGSATSSVATLTLDLPQNFTTTTCESSAQSWRTAIWQANGVGPLVGPVAGNTYEALANGNALGNSALNTRVRTPASGGVESSWTFPGASLTLDTNTELRLKNLDTLNFPGLNGNPGLILNGGDISIADTGLPYPFLGVINIAAQSYLAGGNGTGPGGGTQAGSSVNIEGQLTGSGTLVIMEMETNVPQQISGNANTFSGQWIVKAGWLLGAGAISLGTNSITIDPGWVVPEPSWDPSTVEVSGPALLEVNYNINSAGTLTRTNGGQFKLHQDCSFAAVIIEGTALTAGTHSYAALASQYPANFLAGGSGSITVRSYNASASPPVMLQIQRSGTNVQLKWSQGLLLQATNVTGPWTTNNGATSPFTVAPTAAQKFYRVQVL